MLCPFLYLCKMMMTHENYKFIIKFSSTYWKYYIEHFNWYFCYGNNYHLFYVLIYFFWGHFTLHFNLNFLVYLKVDFIISHPRVPFPLLLYMATLTVVHHTYTEEGMLLLPMPFWVWGTDSEKHPLLHLLTKPSECHQP